MGTLRWEKEDAMHSAAQKNNVRQNIRKSMLETEEAPLEVRLKALPLELQVKRADKQEFNHVESNLTMESAAGKTLLDELRGADKA
jgi:hypothetical protein